MIKSKPHQLQSEYFWRYLVAFIHFTLFLTLTGTFHWFYSWFRLTSNSSDGMVLIKKYMLLTCIVAANKVILSLDSSTVNGRILWDQPLLECWSSCILFSFQSLHHWLNHFLGITNVSSSIQIVSSLMFFLLYLLSICLLDTPEDSKIFAVSLFPHTWEFRNSYSSPSEVIVLIIIPSYSAISISS